MFWRDEIIQLVLPFKLLSQHFSRSNKNETGMCKYKVPLRPVRVTIVAVDKQGLFRIVSVCRLRYPTCTAYVLYYIFIVGNIIFLVIISQTALFSNRIFEHKMCILVFCTTFFVIPPHWHVTDCTPFLMFSSQIT